MRPFVIAAVALAFMSGLAEADGLKIRGGASAGLSPAEVTGLFREINASADAASRVDLNRTGSTAVTRSILSMEPPPPALDAAVPPVPTAGSAPGAEPAKVMKVAEPWCRSGRTVGAGTGFCLIN